MQIRTINCGAARLTAYVPDAELGYNVFRRRPGIVLAPGGAYLIHAIREKEPAAIEFMARGYNVFVLEYSLGDTVPAFIWHSLDDLVVNPSDTTKFVLTLQKKGIDCEYHLYNRGGHGIGLATKTYARQNSKIMPDIARWTTLADEWICSKMGA